MKKIKKVEAREIKDSRGNPTIEVSFKLEEGEVKSSAPSGASTGINEAVELRDEDGGVSQAIDNINKIIAPKIEGLEADNQKGIDQLMIDLDGTQNKSHLGGNTICAVSLALCRAGAKVRGKELFEYVREISGQPNLNIPQPAFNIINGGCHAENNLDVQEFMVSPLEGNFSDKVNSVKEIYKNLENLIRERYGEKSLVLGDEGGFAPKISKAEEAIELILDSSKNKKIGVVLDVAASQFLKDGRYNIEGKKLSKEELVEYYSGLVEKYPILAIEDPFEEEDWEGFRMVNEKLGDKISIIGDDLLVTNSQRIKRAKEENATNAALLKINQIGTVSEALDYARLARNFGWEIMVSHRSGETMDDFIADFAVGVAAQWIKSGATSQKERMVKYNRILEIENKIK